ncbi:hypothetical protein TNCV_3080241 [Trichonephila clavipes]|nr:hypothetical protein TNCV_3080241 [Trichonephila clavipes]
MKSKHSDNERVYTSIFRLFRCNVHLEIATERKHEPARLFGYRITNKKNENKPVKRKATASKKCLKKQWRGDEAHFWLNGYVNKQNCRIWSEANPQVYVETPLHPGKLTVWCALWAGGILLQKR